jgi:hypothetical protein
VTIVFTWYDLVADLQTLVDHRLNSETICLYKGSHTPGAGDSTFNYLGVEGNFGGYQRFPLTFNAAVLTSDKAALTKSQIVAWQSTSTVNMPQTIGGVFALDSTGAVAWAELLPNGPVVMTEVGQVIPYQAVIEQIE